MKKLKKSFLLLLTFMMMFSINIPVFAAEDNSTDFQPVEVHWISVDGEAIKPNGKMEIPNLIVMTVDQYDNNYDGYYDKAILRAQNIGIDTIDWWTVECRLYRNNPSNPEGGDLVGGLPFQPVYDESILPGWRHDYVASLSIPGRGYDYGTGIIEVFEAGHLYRGAVNFS